MNTPLSENTIFEFEDFTGFDLQTYFSDYISFISNDFQKFINFYNGNSQMIEIDSYNNYKSLYDRSQILTDLVKQQTANFNRCDFANLIEMIDTIRIQLMKIDRISIFLKSSLVNQTSTSNVAVTKIVTSTDTMESMHSDKPDNQNVWVDTAVNNRVYESSFDENNGYSIELQQSNVLNFDLKSVIDNLSGDKLYGKDILKTITFTDDLSDVISLNGEDTFQQSIEILSKLKKSDNPLYSELGLDTGLCFGNLIGFNLPFIISDLNNTFATDDTISDFSIDDIQINGNALNLSVSAKSFYNKTFNTIVSLQPSM